MFIGNMYEQYIHHFFSDYKTRLPK